MFQMLSRQMEMGAMIFYVRSQLGIQTFRYFVIYNRDGQKVFIQPTLVWDGMERLEVLHKAQIVLYGWLKESIIKETS